MADLFVLASGVRGDNTHLAHSGGLIATCGCEVEPSTSFETEDPMAVKGVTCRRCAMVADQQYGRRMVALEPS